jgi:hypothetical protein
MPELAGEVIRDRVHLPTGRDEDEIPTEPFVGSRGKMSDLVRIRLPFEAVFVAVGLVPMKFKVKATLARWAILTIVSELLIVASNMPRPRYFPPL